MFECICEVFNSVFVKLIARMRVVNCYEENKTNVNKIWRQMDEQFNLEISNDIAGIAGFNYYTLCIGNRI